MDSRHELEQFLGEETQLNKVNMVNKEDVLHTLNRLVDYITDMDDDDFDDFSDGSPVCSSFIPFEWRMPRGGSYTRRIANIEVRIK